MIAHPEAAVAAAEAAPTVRGPGAPRGRRAGRLHPGLQGVPRGGLRGRCPGADPATRDRACSSSWPAAVIAERLTARASTGRHTAAPVADVGHRGRRRSRSPWRSPSAAGGCSTRSEIVATDARPDALRARPRERGRPRRGGPDGGHRGRPPAARGTPAGLLSCRTASTSSAPTCPTSRPTRSYRPAGRRLVRAARPRSTGARTAWT